MAGLVEPNQVGKREDLSNMISVIDAKKFPYSTMATKDAKPENMLTSWQMDKEKAISAASQSGIKDGTDVTSHGNPAENRVLASVYGQWFREADKVGKLAEKVSNVAGAPSEVSRGVKRLLRAVKRNIEVKCLSDDETQAEGSAGAYELRGLGKWLLASANAVLPVAAGFRTPSASIDTTTNTSSNTEDKITDVMESIWDQVGEESDLDAFLGSKQKKRIDKLQLAGDTQAAADTIVARNINKSQSDVKMVRKIDIIENSFGSIKLHLSSYLAYADGVKTAAASDGRMYLMNMKGVRLRFSEAPNVEFLPNNGGGQRYAVSAVLSHQLDNPLEHGKFTPTAD